MLVKYAADMGLPPNFVASIMGRPMEDLQYLETVAQFLSFHVCPIGLDRPSIGPAAQAINVCNHSTDWADPSLTLEAKAIPAEQARLYLLEQLQRNMQAVNSRGRLSDQLRRAP